MRDKRLHIKVRENLLKRIRKREWKPGEAIPNEFDIAADNGVSQGTARRAIAQLASEGVLTRHQGRGTFVAVHGTDQTLYRFPHFVDGAGNRVEFGSLPCAVSKGSASAPEREALDLGAGEQVLRLYRLRTFKDSAVMCEAISLPARLFRSMKAKSATGEMYDLYQRDFGIHVVRVSDRASSVPADTRRARELGLRAGTPLLRVDRVACAIGGQKVEWRVSISGASEFHYLMEHG